MGFLRALRDPKTRTLYHWRCSCGAHSRGDGGWLFESDAEYNARRHQEYEGVLHHTMPEVYTTDEAID